MLFDEVREIISNQLEISEDEIENDSRLYEDLGAGSADMVDIGMTIEEQYSIEVTEDTLEEMEIVGDIVAFIESNID